MACLVINSASSQLLIGNSSISSSGHYSQGVRRLFLPAILIFAAYFAIHNNLIHLPSASKLLHEATTKLNGKHTNKDNGQTTTKGGKLSLVTEPAAGDAPFVRLIAHAHHSVELTMYELSDNKIDQALIAAHRRKVKVRVLLDGGYYGDRSTGISPEAYKDLATHGVDVQWTPKYFALTHQKTLTVDGKVSAIMTLNLTSIYYPTSRDFAILDRQPRDVRAIVATFNADWSGHKLDNPPRGSGDLVWSPGALGIQLGLINQAKHSLDIENEEMDDSTITNALCAAARRGVAVRIVMTYSSEWSDAFHQLQGCGVKIHLFHGEHPLYIHAKEIDVDDSIVNLGSQNFSANSLEHNRELGIIVSNKRIIAALKHTFNSDFARATNYSS
jgi:cardiolipin synthase